MSFTKSLDAVGSCLAGISMIVLSRVLVVCCTIVLMASQPPFAVAALASHNRSDVKVLLKTFAADAAAVRRNITTASFCCVAATDR
jgi:hypothetical protein